MIKWFLPLHYFTVISQYQLFFFISFCPSCVYFSNSLLFICCDKLPQKVTLSGCERLEAWLKSETVIFSSSHQKLIRFHYFFIFMCHSLFLFTFTHLMREKCAVSLPFSICALDCCLHFSMSLNKNKDIRICDADQFHCIDNIHAKWKTESTHCRRLLHSISYHLFVFISEKHLFYAVFCFFFFFCYISKCLYFAIYLCEMKAHARTYSHPKTWNRWIHPHLLFSNITNIMSYYQHK